jgi:hypothetical protein
MLSRTAEPPHAPAPAFSAPHSGGHVNLGDGVGFELGIVGESHYVPELQEIAKRRKAACKPADFIATLMPEPNNPYDPLGSTVLAARFALVSILSANPRSRPQ